MKNAHQTMLQEYEALIRQELEINERYKALDGEKANIEGEIEGTKVYLQKAFYDPAVKKEFQRITQLKKELTSNGKPAKVAGPNKTHVIIQIFQEHGQEGLEIGDVVTFLNSDSYNVEMNRNYVTTIIGKLKKRGLIEKQGNKFFLTQPGKNTKAAAG
jgi:predicted transcriptional regulator